jgi:multidrug efflux pump subunit AcrA (membrane-fusion protein)
MKKSILVAAALIVGSLAGLSAVPTVRGWVHSLIPGLGIEGADPSYVAAKQAVVSPEGTELNALPSEGEIQQPEGRLVDLEPAPTSDKPLPVDPYVQLAQATTPIPTRTIPSAPNGPVARFAQTGQLEQVPREGVAVPSANFSTVLVDESAALVFVNDIVVSAQADGVITNLSVDDGMVVKEKAGIYELDTRLAEAEIGVQTKELEQAELKANDNSNLAYARAAEKVALKEYEMSNDLFQNGAEDRLANEKKGLEVQKAQLQIKVSEVEKLRDAAAVGVANEKLKAAKVQVDLRTIVAPWDGFVSEVKKRRFEYVRAGEPICKLTDMRRIRVSGTINVTTPTPPNRLLNSPATIKIQVAPGIFERVDGVVGYVAPNSSIPNRYPFWVEIENRVLPDGQYLFRGGMLAKVEITPRN